MGLHNQLKLKIAETSDSHDIEFDMKSSSHCNNDLIFCGGRADYNPSTKLFESFGESRYFGRKYFSPRA